MRSPDLIKYVSDSVTHPLSYFVEGDRSSNYDKIVAIDIETAAFDILLSVCGSDSRVSVPRFR